MVSIVAMRGFIVSRQVSICKEVGQICGPELVADLTSGATYLDEAQCLFCENTCGQADVSVVAILYPGAGEVIRILFAHATCSDSAVFEDESGPAPTVQRTDTEVTCWPLVTVDKDTAQPTLVVSPNRTVRAVCGADSTDLAFAEMLEAGMELHLGQNVDQPTDGWLCTLSEDGNATISNETSGNIWTGLLVGTEWVEKAKENGNVSVWYCSRVLPSEVNPELVDTYLGAARARGELAVVRMVAR